MNKNQTRAQIFVKLIFRESRDLKLSGLYSFDNMAIFVTLTENSSFTTYDTQGP